MITNDGRLKMIGFSQAKCSKKRLTDVTGTPYYIAPEVLNRNHHTKSDLWSAGVILYYLVSGYYPFNGSSQNEVFEKIKSGDFNFDHSEFDKVTDECKDLIKQLLVVNEEKRLDAKAALRHPLFAKFGLKVGDINDEVQAGQISDKVIDRLREFEGKSIIKRAALDQVVQTATEEEVSDLRAQFQAINIDGTGMIKPEELRAAL